MTNVIEPNEVIGIDVGKAQIAACRDGDEAVQFIANDALALSRWSVSEMEDAWDYWDRFIPDEKDALFQCGAAMSLCDMGHRETAVSWLNRIYEPCASAIVKKWRYLRDARPDFLTRYAPLFDYLERQGVFDKEAA